MGQLESHVGAAAYHLGVRSMKVYAFIGIAAGAGAYALGTGPWWSVAIGFCAPTLAELLPPFVAGAVSGALTPSTHEDAAGRAQALAGVQFEDYVARIARTCGLPVIMTPATGDWGVDLIVGRRPDRLAIQCKRASRPVGPAAVQEVVAGAPMQDCTRTMVVTNHEFTAAARRLAELHGCELVVGRQLPQLRSLIRRTAAPKVS